MPNDTTIISNIAHLIQLAVAPVFLLTGVGSLLMVLTNRLARIVDRSRVVEKELPDAPEAAQKRFQLELRRLRRRARLITWSISLCTICALLVCALIAILFVGDMISVYVAQVVGLLFISAMLSLIGALLCFLREVHITIQNLAMGLH